MPTRIKTRGAIQPLTKGDYETLAQLRYLLRQFIGFSEDAARAAGLAPRQHQALLAIHGFPGREAVTVGELAERMHLRHHSAVGLLDRLSRLRLVQRRRDGADRRRVLIALTALGRRKLAALSAAHRRELSRLAPTLGLLLTQVAASPRAARARISP